MICKDSVEYKELLEIVISMMQCKTLEQFELLDDKLIGRFAETEIEHEGLELCHKFDMGRKILDTLKEDNCPDLFSMEKMLGKREYYRCEEERLLYLSYLVYLCYGDCGWDFEIPQLVSLPIMALKHCYRLQIGSGLPMDPENIKDLGTVIIYCLYNPTNPNVDDFGPDYINGVLLKNKGRHFIDLLDSVYEQEKREDLKLISNLLYGFQQVINHFKMNIPIKTIEWYDSKSSLIESKPELIESEIFSKMDDIIGLHQVKQFIRDLYALLKVQKMRIELGLSTNSAQTIHLIFKGNPGTGKTTFARIVAEMLHLVGYLSTSKLTEVDRSNLVAGYVGQTAIQTKQTVMDAMDGVLFIDEAYSLGNDATSSQNGFGKEAIDTLVKAIDDNRERIVVILAGYSTDMDDFLNINPGLKSRFPNVIEFPDYSTDELLQIAEKMYQSSDYQLTTEAKMKLATIFDQARTDSQFGNGRYVRNIFEKSQRLQSRRLQHTLEATREHFMEIRMEDIEGI